MQKVVGSNPISRFTFALERLLDRLDLQQALLVVRLATVTIVERAEEDVLARLLQVELRRLRKAAVEDRRRLRVLEVEVGRRGAVLLREVALDLVERWCGPVHRHRDDQVEGLIALRLEGDVVLTGVEARGLPGELVLAGLVRDHLAGSVR